MSSVAVAMRVGVGVSVGVVGDVVGTGSVGAQAASSPVARSTMVSHRMNTSEMLEREGEVSKPSLT